MPVIRLALAQMNAVVGGFAQNVETMGRFRTQAASAGADLVVSPELALTGWAAHLPLAGEEQVPVENDCVDLTPVIREDILLDFPQHPLCKPDCAGLKSKTVRKVKAVEQPAPDLWAKLDKLKLK